MTIAPYGSWPSPISIEALTAGSVGLAGVRIDGDQLYWLESYADQGGRTALWRRPLAGGDRGRGDPGPGVRTQPGARVRRR